MIDLKKPLVIDVDDVTLNWLMGGFRPYVMDVTGKEICAKGPHGWDMEEWLDTDKAGVRELITNFNASHDFGKIPAFDCAMEVLPKVAETGRRIHVVTSCAADPEIHRRREQNLIDIFGDIFATITCLDVNVSKAPRLYELIDEEGRPGIWLEDNHKNATAGADLGYITYMFRRSHNRSFEQNCNHPNIAWVNTWHDVAPHLLP
jgi:hypothetical protein